MSASMTALRWHRHRDNRCLGQGAPDAQDHFRRGRQGRPQLPADRRDDRAVPAQLRARIAWRPDSRVGGGWRGRSEDDCRDREIPARPRRFRRWSGRSGRCHPSRACRPPTRTRRSRCLHRRRRPAVVLQARKAAGSLPARASSSLRAGRRAANTPRVRKVANTHPVAPRAASSRVVARVPATIPLARRVVHFRPAGCHRGSGPARRAVAVAPRVSERRRWMAMRHR